MLELMEKAFSRTNGRPRLAPAQQDLLAAIDGPEFRPLITLERPDRTGLERIVAFALGAFNGDHVTYVHGAAERGGGLGRLPLAYAPVWELMRWAADRGATWFDLGGIPPTDDPNHPLAGIASFKRRFGGQDIEVASELHLTLSPLDTRIERAVGLLLPK
jgi:lipid II:glycine glycyltransferase (peptidoglycan interpeptide bridge formation enzyme)